ncbi:Fanconi anemia group J protein [Homalodisca vitripennis]|nr:Fanconi anemia group J protein [Homalodisca vitripennis]
MTILAARDHTCVNDMVRGKPNVTELCKAAIDPVMGVSCLYYGVSSKISNFESLSNYGLPIVYDIEDMVCVGKKRRVCPYFTLRNLVTQAGIIFCPYNYLIDPRIRSSMNVNLTKSIVIMDEAHNIEDICREAGSLLLKQSDLEEAMSECRDNIKKDRNPEEYKIIEDFLQSLYSWLDSLGPTVQYSDMNEAKTTMTGEDVVNRLHLSNVSQENFQIFQDNLEKIETTKAEQPDLNYGISGKIKLLCDDIVVVLNYLYNPKNISKYKAYLNREVGSNERKEQKKRNSLAFYTKLFRLLAGIALWYSTSVTLNTFVWQRCKRKNRIVVGAKPDIMDAYLIKKVQEPSRGSLTPNTSSREELSTPPPPSQLGNAEEIVNPFECRSRLSISPVNTNQTLSIGETPPSSVTAQSTASGPLPMSGRQQNQRPTRLSLLLLGRRRRRGIFSNV